MEGKCFTQELQPKKKNTESMKEMETHRFATAPEVTRRSNAISSSHHTPRFGAQEFAFLTNS